MAAERERLAALEYSPFQLPGDELRHDLAGGVGSPESGPELSLRAACACDEQCISSDVLGGSVSPTHDLIALMRDLDLAATADDSFPLTPAPGIGYSPVGSASSACVAPVLFCDCSHDYIPLGSSVSPARADQAEQAFMRATATESVACQVRVEQLEAAAVDSAADADHARAKCDKAMSLVAALVELLERTAAALAHMETQVATLAASIVALGDAHGELEADHKAVLASSRALADDLAAVEAVRDVAQSMLHSYHAESPTTLLSCHAAKAAVAAESAAAEFLEARLHTATLLIKDLVTDRSAEKARADQAEQALMRATTADSVAGQVRVEQLEAAAVDSAADADHARAKCDEAMALLASSVKLLERATAALAHTETQVATRAASLVAWGDAYGVRVPQSRFVHPAYRTSRRVSGAS